MISNELPVAIQNSINVGCAGRLIVSLKFDFAFGRLAQNTNQYKTNYRQYQTRQKFDYHTECPKVDTVFDVQEIRLRTKEKRRIRVNMSVKRNTRRRRKKTTTTMFVYMLSISNEYGM